jgi:hypothetical protein
MEGRKEEQYKKSPYINNNNNNSNIEEMMSKMTINEEKEVNNPYKIESKEIKKEEKEKKWAEKEGYKKGIKPYWKKRLDEIENSFINETVKEVIESFVNLKINNIEKIHAFYKKNEEEERFFYLMYSMIFPQVSAVEILNKEVFKNSQIRPSLIQSNHSINFSFGSNEDKLDWYKGSDPFCRIFEGKISPVPKTEEEGIEMVEQIARVIGFAHIETMLELEKGRDIWLDCGLKDRQMEKLAYVVDRMSEEYNKDSISM